MIPRSSRLVTLLSLCAISTAISASAEQGYVIHKVMDKNGTGGVAMTFEVPQGWTTQDNLRWDLNLRMNPMSYGLTTGGPDGRWFSFLSGLTFDFVNSGGAWAGKQPPAHASDFLVEDFRAVHPNLPYEVVDQQNNPIPFPYKPTVPGVIAIARHSVLTVKFEGPSGPMEETLSYDFYGYSQPTGPGSFRGNWFVSGLTVVNAPAGQLGAVQQIGNKILGSERMSTAFQNRYQEVCKMLLDKTIAETQAARERRAHLVVVGGGGSTHHVMDKDEFILHEQIKGLRSQLWSRSIGN